MSAYAAGSPVVVVPEIPEAESDPVDAIDRAIGVFFDQLVERVADAVAASLDAASTGNSAEWLDSRDAASYLGVHRDTLRRLAAERAIQSEQEGPGCKLYFLRSDLDSWRRDGGRVAHLTTAA
jgi:excisionase family DNA binding protein